MGHITNFEAGKKNRIVYIWPKFKDSGLIKKTRR